MTKYAFGHRLGLTVKSGTENTIRQGPRFSSPSWRPTAESFKGFQPWVIEIDSATTESLPSERISPYTTASPCKPNRIGELNSGGARREFGLLRSLNDVEQLVGSGKGEHEIPTEHASTVSEHAVILKRRSAGRIITHDGDADSFPSGVHSRTGLGEDGGLAVMPTRTRRRSQSV